MVKEDTSKRQRGRSPPSRKRNSHDDATRNADTTVGNTICRTTKSSNTITLSSTILILFQCTLFSLVMTIFILYFVFDYQEEVNVIINEAWNILKVTSVFQYHQYFSSQEFLSVSSLVPSSLRSILQLSSILPANLIPDESNNNDLVFINETFKIIHDINHIPSLCKEKNYLSQTNSNNSDQHIDRHHQQQQKQCRNILNDQMKQSFKQHGVIAIRGLLSNNLFHQLNESSYRKVQHHMLERGIGGRSSSGKQFLMNPMSVAFTNDDDSQSGGESDNQPSSGFRDVALSSLIPQVVSELLNMTYYDDDDDDQGTHQYHNLRMLRDVLLVKDSEQFICGWHVDDLGFWPSTAKSPGINAWIAIDDMSSSTGGNFAVSVGSHIAPWRYEIYELTGATTTIPEEGFKDAEDMFTNRKGAGTCNIKNVNKSLHDKIEERMHVYDLKAGDILFLDRWLFHRTVPFHRDLVKKMRQKGTLDQLISRRYSIRYTPGNAQLPKGFGTELSILWNEDNQGRTLDEVGVKDGPWYPKCWPHSASSKELNDIQNLMSTKLPYAETKRKHRMTEMKPYLQKLGKQQRDQLKLHARNALRDNDREL